MEVHSFVEMRSGGRRDIAAQQLRMDDNHAGIWNMKIDLKTLLGIIVIFFTLYIYLLYFKFNNIKLYYRS